MGFLSTFSSFVNRVMRAVDKGGLNAKDSVILGRLLNRTRKKNLILSKAILSALSSGGATKEDVKKFGDMLENAHERILKNNDPFTRDEEKELSVIFRKALISEKAARWFANNLDELVATEIEDFIKERQIVASKKTIKIMDKKQNNKIVV